MREELLERAPRLNELLHLPGVASAIDRGDMHALYYALEKAKRRGRPESRAIDEVLADVTLFLTPVESAPTLYTLNLIGWSMTFGKRLDEELRIALHAFVILFLPIFPHGRYLVAKDGSTYHFFGKLPFTPFQLMWRRSVQLGAGLAAIAGAFAIYASATTAEMQLINALDIPLELSVGDQQIMVPPHTRAGLEVPIGRLHLEARREDGQLVEELDVEVERYRDLVAWNVLGAAPLYVESIRYAERDDGIEPPPTVLLAGRSFVQRDVNWAFEPAPESVSLSRTQKFAIRTRADVGSLDWRDSVQALTTPEEAKESLQLLKRVALAEGDALHLTREVILFAQNVAEVLVDEDVLLDTVRGWREAAPTSVEAHRAYQTVSQQRGLDLTEEYRARYAASGDPNDGYLLARILPDAEGFALAEQLAREHPDNPRLQGAVGWHYATCGKWTEAARAYDARMALAPGTVHEAFAHHAVALVGAGRLDEALELAKKLPARFDYQTAVIEGRLARLAGGAESDAPLAMLQRKIGVEPPPELAAAFSVSLGLPPEASLVEAIADEATRAARSLERQLFMEPASLKAKVSEADGEVLAAAHGELALIFAALLDDRRRAEEIYGPRLPLTEKDLVFAWLYEGRDDPRLWLGGPNESAALKVARAMRLGGEERRRLLAEARAADPLRGPASRAADALFGEALAGN